MFSRIQQIQDLRRACRQGLVGPLLQVLVSGSWAYWLLNQGEGHAGARVALWLESRKAMAAPSSRLPTSPAHWGLTRRGWGVGLCFVPQRPSLPHPAQPEPRRGHSETQVMWLEGRAVSFEVRSGSRVSLGNQEQALLLLCRGAEGAARPPGAQGPSARGSPQVARQGGRGGVQRGAASRRSWRGGGSPLGRTVPFLTPPAPSSSSPWPRVTPPSCTVTSWSH